MTETLNTARRMLERTGRHPVLSLYFDLDPGTFATAPARATQLRSLIDEARQTIEQGDRSLAHEDKAALASDLDRVESYLRSRPAEVDGARALAVFCSAQDDLFEAVQLPEPAEPRVVIAPTPYVEPLLTAGEDDGWCVTLVNRRTARILEGEAHQLHEQGHLTDDVHGQHKQGGRSQANYQRSYEEEAEAHLRRVADELHRRFKRRERFRTLALGGPEEAVSRLRELLHNDLGPLLVQQRLALDVAAATEADVRAALVPILAERRAAAERAALSELTEGLATAGRATAGTKNTVAALTERRVRTLLLAPPPCPADAVREQAIEAAVLQDADVVVFSAPPPQDHLREGIGAVLRF